VSRKFEIIGDRFEVCPVCGERHNIRFLSITTLCDSCGWDSSNAFVDSGAFDRLIFAYETMQANKIAAKNRAARVQRTQMAERLAV